MANTIKIKRGPSSNVYNAHLEEGELAITTDTHELFVGTGPSKIPEKVTDYPKYIVDGSAYGIKSIYATESSGQNSLAFGSQTKATGDNSQALGFRTESSGNCSHAEGWDSIASGNYGSHAEGVGTKASGWGSHAEGDTTKASGDYQHVQGKYNIEDTTNAHIIGNGTSEVKRSNAHTVAWDGTAWYQGDVYVGSTSGTNKDDGSVKLAKITEVPTKTSQLTNDSNFITNEDIPSNIVDGKAEGSIRSINAYDEGLGKLLGQYAQAFGYYTIASNEASHAEGKYTEASGNHSHAEGSYTTASGEDSHAEGGGSKAIGTYSHAEGCSTTASEDYSHAEGYRTKTSGAYQHVQGKYNIEDTTSAHIIGNGPAEDSKSNAHTIDWKGNAWFAGDIYTGSTSGTNKDDGSKKLATEDFVTTQIENSIPVSATPPLNPSDGDLWIDTSDTASLAEVDSTVSTVSENAVSNKAITNYVNERLNGTLLWKNNALGDNFGPQTLNLDLSPYSIIELVYYRYPSITTPIFRVFHKIGETTQLNYCDYDSGTPRAWSREIQITANSLIIANNWINGNIENKGLVLDQVIGHK